jgi:hypothetical protein
MELFGTVDARHGAARSDSLPDESNGMAYDG